MTKNMYKHAKPQIDQKSSKLPSKGGHKPEASPQGRRRPALVVLKPASVKIAASAKSSARPSKPRTSKLAQVTAMLREKRGASLSDLMKATGWQAHSVRGALSGSLKKRLGLSVRSDLVDGERRYRIEA